MATSALYRMPSGVAGSVTRNLDSTVESVFLNSAKPVLAYGAPVKLVSGKAEPFEAGDDALDFYGVMARTAPSISGSTAQTFASQVPNTDTAQGVLTRGYINVSCKVGTPVRGGAVYVRMVADTGKAIGDFEATSSVAATGVAGTNTGNGTIGTISATQSAVSGAYKVTFTAATVFSVYNPNGDLLKAGATGTAYTADGLTFTITAGGTAFIAGDTFTVTVVKNNEPINAVWAVDGKDGDNNAEIRVRA